MYGTLGAEGWGWGVRRSQHIEVGGGSTIILNITMSGWWHVQERGRRGIESGRDERGRARLCGKVNCAIEGGGCNGVTGGEYQTTNGVIKIDKNEFVRGIFI